MQLARENHPELLKNVDFILEDDQYTPKNSIAAFNKLKDIDHAQLVLVWGNEPALAVAPLAESIKYPVIAFGQTPAIAAHRNYVLRILGPAAEFGKPIAQYLRSHKVASVQMILLENTFYRLVSDSIKEALDPGTKFEVLAAVPATEMDFKTYLLKLKQNPNDYAGAFLAPAQLVPFFKQANELHVTNPIFGSTSFESKTVAAEGKGLINGAIYAHVNIDPKWQSEYFAKFGNTIQVSYAAVAYDTIIAIAKTVAELGKSATGMAVLESLSKLPAQHGAAGKFFATESEEHGRYVAFEVALKKMENGDIHVVQ
jgi:ABC-type branched-subunit amino acid transport system substrate-binding protein